ncbi:hypothetical protein WA158_004514 [Blastocystis sp. Blastoise]
MSTSIELKPVESIDVQIRRNSTIAKQELPGIKYNVDGEEGVSTIVVQQRASSVIGDDPLFQDHDPVRIAQIIKSASTAAAAPAGDVENNGANPNESKTEDEYINWYDCFKGVMPTIGIIGILCAIALLFIPLTENVSVQRCAAVLVLMAIFWVTEMLPLAVTALFPVVFFPFLSVLKNDEVASQYFNNTIFMFFSGFLMSLAMERWNLHIRISCAVTQLFKTPRSLLFGIMFVTWFLSMWISNTASALMMVANANAIILNLENRYGTKKMEKFSKAIMIGIAFSCNCGGLATLIGTPPNMIFQQMYQERFKQPGTPEITFANWLFSQFPTSLLLFILIWLFLAFLYTPSSKEISIDVKQSKAEYHALGKASYEEWVVGIAFIILAFLWLFRATISFGSFEITGWTNLLNLDKYVSDATVGMAMSLLLFIWPTKALLNGKLKSTDQKFILTWETAKKLPWDLVLLFGGGFALAKACTSSGFSAYLGGLLSGLRNLPLVLCIFIISLIVCVLTSFTSNTATASIIIPIMISIALEIKQNPLFFLFPATLATSCAYLMPVGTPPNLIVFTSGKITIVDMFKCGACVTVFAVIAILFSTFVMVPAVYGAQMDVFPEWAIDPVVNATSF